MTEPAFDQNYSVRYETLWKAIIRPPRLSYEDKELGRKDFKFRKKNYFRKDYNLLSSQGYILKCSFFQPMLEDRPTYYMPVVIYLHGNSSSRLEGIKMFQLLAANGINLFVFDFAGCGKSEGEYISLGYYEQHDVRIVVDFLESQPGVSKIGLWGRSMGAATTLLYAHTDPRISAICLDSAFANFKRLAQEMCKNVIKLPTFVIDTAIGIINHTIKKKNGLDISKLDPIGCASKTECPAIFIHGKKDELISVQHCFDICEEYAGDRSIKTPEGKHNTPRPRYVLEEIGRFFGKNLVPGYVDSREINASLFDDFNSDTDDKDDAEPKGFENI